MEISEGTKYILAMGATLVPIVWMIRRRIDDNNIPTMYDSPDTPKLRERTVQAIQSSATRLVESYRELGAGATRPSAIIRGASISATRGIRRLLSQ